MHCRRRATQVTLVALCGAAALAPTAAPTQETEYAAWRGVRDA